MSQEACGKIGIPEENVQADNTRKPDKFTTSINGLIYEEAKTGPEEIQQIITENKYCQYYVKDKGITEDGYSFHGKVGENHIDAVADIVLGLKPVEFDKEYHGIDGIFRDKNGKLVIVEAKFSEGGDGKRELSVSKSEREEEKKIRQMSNEWLEKRLTEMEGNDKKQGKNHELYSELNAEKAGEIRKARDYKELTRLLIHTNTKCLNVVISECNDDEKWTPIKAFRFAKFE